MAIRLQPLLPLQIGGNGQITMIEQDGPLDYAQRGAVICRTPPGWLDSRPDLGLADQAGRKGGANIAEIQRQLATYVPGASYVIELRLPTLDQALEEIGVRVSSR